MKKLTPNSFKAFIVSLMIVMFTVGCGTKEDVEEASNENNLLTTVALDEDLITEGEKITTTQCISCHGRDLTGDMGPSLLHLNLTDEEIEEVLIKGRGSMPPGTANGKEEAVIVYLKSIQEK